MNHVIKANTEAELGILGVLIKDGDPDSLVVRQIINQLEEDYFFNSHHKEVYKVIKKSYDEKQFFTEQCLLSLTIAPKVQMIVERNIIAGYISKNMTPYHLEELKMLHALRKQLHMLGEMTKEVNEEIVHTKAQEIMRNGLKSVGELGLRKKNEGKSFDEIKQAYLNNEYQQHGEVPCAIKQFGMIKNGSLITIAGQSGIGKTFFGIYLMHQIAKYQQEKQVLFYSLEMKENEIWERYLSIVKDAPIREINDFEAPLVKGKVFDRPRITIEDIETLSHLEALSSPISVIVVDYLALVTSTGKFDREDLRLSDITQRLAALALELNCIVICLSQVNREATKRDKSDRCPYPHDVADSVGSVRSSSLWIGIDRPEIYDPSYDKKNLFVAKCRKSRYGNNFEAWFDFNGGLFRERHKPYWQDARKTLNDYLTEEY